MLANSRSRALAAALALLPALTGISCSRDDKVEARDAAARAPIVAAAKVTRQDLNDAITLTAEFRPFQEVDVMAKVSGYVKEIPVDVGDRVHRGQLLALLEIPEMADDAARAHAAVERSSADVTRARDEIQRAESAHSMAHLSHERLSSISRQRPGLIAQQEIDDARSRDLVAEAQIASAKSALRVTLQQVDVQKAELGKVNTLNAYARVTAPFDGIITRRFADTGSMIQAGTASQTQAMPVVRLSDNSLLRLIIPAPESAVPRVRVGALVDVRVQSLDRVFTGKVARIAARVQPATRTMEVEVDVPNPGLLLVPGMYAEARMILDRRAAALTVPVTAVDHGDGTKDRAGHVLLVTPEGRLESRDVILGLESADSVEIRSGIKEGDLVVTGPRSHLQAGQRVTARVTAAEVETREP